MSGVKSVSKHEEALAGGGSFVPQGGKIALQNFTICVCRTTCLTMCTNFFYQGGSTKTTGGPL